jgi:hypothetical protein
MPLYTWKGWDWTKVCEKVRKMKHPAGRHVVQNMVNLCQGFKTNKTLILKCMYHACLSRYCLQVGSTLCTYIYTQATLVQSSYNTTNQKTPLLPAVYQAMHTSLYFMSPLQARDVYVTPLIYVMISSVLQGGCEIQWCVHGMIDSW